MIAIGNTKITKAFLGQTELKNIAIGDELLLSSEEPLPEGVVKIEYLESTGTQYINTGYYPNENTVMSVRYYCKRTGESPVSCRWTGASTYDTFGLYVKNASVTVAYYGRYSANEYKEVSANNSQVLTAEMGISQITINAASVAITRSAFNSTYPIYLFAMNNVGNVAMKARMKLYSFSLSENSTQIMDMIPVRVGTTGYMFDKVSKTLFGNAGTGDFVLGNDV